MDSILKHRRLIGHICGIGSVIVYFLFSYKTHGIPHTTFMACLIYISGYAIVVKWHIITNVRNHRKMSLTAQYSAMDMGYIALQSGLIIMIVVGIVAWKLYQPL